MLLDYISRLSRYEPRLRRFLGSKNSSEREPVQAFMGGRSGSATPTPIPPTQTGPESHHGGGGFSVIDIERWVLAKVWGSDSTPAARSSPSREDSQGLDVDLSELFARSATVADVKSAVEASATPAASRRFLNYYSKEALIEALGTTGILAALEKKGYKHPALVFDTSDSFQHRLSLVDASLFKPELHLSSSESFLIDLYMKRRRSWGTDQMVCYQVMTRELTGEIRAPYVGLEGAREVISFFETSVPKYSKLAKKGGGEWDVSELAWMQMHDPFATTTRPLLPGQRFPGLGLGRQIGKIMEGMAEHSKVTDALLNFPFHYHNAVAYEALGYKHFCPVYSAYFQWFHHQLQPTIEAHGFCFVAWAVSMGHVRRITEQLEPGGHWTKISNRLERWSASEQVFVTGPGPQAFLGCSEWERIRSKYREILWRDGAANMEGVSVVEPEAGAVRRSTLQVDLEGCPELWQYSTIWSKRDPETGNFQ
ncbi:hypothetical protein RQP46_006494 [Phenoliferia psychrophenolica]